VASDALVGVTLGDFRIEELIGQGATSRVYRAVQLSLDRNVALKVLSSDLSADPSLRSRFLQESRLASSLDHPNVLPIYGAGEANGLLYMAMRYVQGTDLRKLIASTGPLAQEVAFSVASQTASALNAAHLGGLIHRDVKPANLLLSEGHVYLSDFGIARLFGSARGMTQIGLFAGTIDYASPEQIRGEELDGRSDLYSLACVLFECLTGVVPFDKPTEHDVLQAHLNENPPDPRSIRPLLPASTTQIIATGMAKDRSARFRDGAHFARALQGLSQPASPVAPSERRTLIVPRPSVVESRGPEPLPHPGPSVSARRQWPELWPGSARGRLAAALLLANCFVLVMFAVVEFQIAELIRRYGSAVSTAPGLSTLTSIEDALAGLSGVLFWVTALFWWIWLYGAVRRARDQGCELSLSPVSSVFTWFIPIVFLVTGYRSVRQLFNLPGMTGSSIVAWWWALFLGGSFVSRATASAITNAAGPSALTGLVAWEIAGVALTTGSGVLAMWIVARVDRGLREASNNPQLPIAPSSDQSRDRIVSSAASSGVSSQIGTSTLAPRLGAALRGRRSLAIIFAVVIAVAAGIRWAPTIYSPSSSLSPASSPSVETDARVLGLSTHRVESGESTFGIASAERVAPTDLINANLRYYPDIAQTTPPIGSLLLIPRSTASTLGPTQALAPTLTPGPTHPYPVALRPEQVIMPQSEFPLAGYTQGRDMAGNSPTSGRRWLRDFESTSGQYWYANFIITVYTPDVAATSAIARTACSGIWDWTASKEQPVITEIAAEVIGDGAKACRYAFPTLSDVVSYTTGTRNVTVTTTVSVRTVGIPQAIATCVLLAKQQLGIIERVAPR
jgi:serine/threonine protein kinase